MKDRQITEERGAILMTSYQQRGATQAAAQARCFVHIDKSAEAVIYEMCRQSRENYEAVVRVMSAERRPTVFEAVNETARARGLRTFEETLRTRTLNGGELSDGSGSATVYVLSDGSYVSPLPSGALAVGRSVEEKASRAARDN